MNAKYKLSLIQTKSYFSVFSKIKCIPNLSHLSVWQDMGNALPERRKRSVDVLRSLSHHLAGVQVKVR